MSAKRTSRPSVSATEAAKTFGRLVNRVREERTTYIVERGGVQVARIGPVETPTATIRDLKAVLAEPRRRDVDFARAVDQAVRRHNTPRVRRNPWER